MIRKIGEGAYGEVWLGINVAGVCRAIKIIYRDRFEHKGPYERELSGIKRYEPISREHDGLVDILHIGRNEGKGFFYYVMELADDQHTGHEIDPATYKPKTLRSELIARENLPIAECLKQGVHLARGLARLHACGLAHRDIKPANIIYVKGKPRLADIGLVKALDDSVSFAGTIGYVPLEGPGRSTGDVFSLGKVLYEMLTGMDRTEFPSLPNSFRDNNQPDLNRFNQIIFKACEHKPAKRYQKADQLADDLEELIDKDLSAYPTSVVSLLYFWRLDSFWTISVGKLVAIPAVVTLLAFSIFKTTDATKKAQEKIAYLKGFVPVLAPRRATSVTSPRTNTNGSDNIAKAPKSTLRFPYPSTAITQSKDPKNPVAELKAANEALNQTNSALENKIKEIERKLIELVESESDRDYLDRELEELRQQQKNQQLEKEKLEEMLEKHLEAEWKLRESNVLRKMEELLRQSRTHSGEIEGGTLVIPSGHAMAGIPLVTFLEEYGTLVGRTPKPKAGLPNVTFYFKTKKDYTFPEAKAFYEALLYERKIAVVPEGDKFVKIVPTAEAAKRKAEEKVKAEADLKAQSDDEKIKSLQSENDLLLEYIKKNSERGKPEVAHAKALEMQKPGGLVPGIDSTTHNEKYLEEKYRHLLEIKRKQRESEIR